MLLKTFKGNKGLVTGALVTETFKKMLSIELHRDRGAARKMKSISSANAEIGTMIGCSRPSGEGGIAEATGEASHGGNRRCGNLG